MLLSKFIKILATVNS